jgi:hypothetical protein
MADNIKIVGSILGTSQVSRYTTDDLKLITSLKIKKSFSTFNDYIEYHVYNIDGQLLENNYNYRGYKLPSNFSINPGVNSNLNINNTTATGAEVGNVSSLSTTSSTYPVIEIDPVMDLEKLGYTSGEFKVQYNIFKNKISKFPSAELFIKEISSDRTEIRVGSVVLSNSQLESGSLALINSYNSSSIFDPFLLNFGDNKQSIATNIVLNKIDTGYEILFKLYTELDTSIIEKSSLWVVEEISTPYVFDINLDTILSSPKSKKLKGPNFNNISRFGLGSTTSPYSNNFANDQEGLFNLNNSQSIDINVNYSGVEGENGGFNSFINFGSAVSRIQNFFYKLQQIETGSYFISKYTPYISTTSSLQSEINLYSSSINNIISNFDGFENYLYFESGSLTSSIQYGITPFPKSNSLKPYNRQPLTSSNAIIWYSSSISNAEDYDSNNVNYFKYSVPGYLIDDSSNENYVTFLNMMGQYFDNIWIYIKSITDRNLSNNNLNIGVSKDVVYNLLQSLGIGIFNSFGDQSIANYLLGNSGSGNFNENSTLSNIPATLFISSASLSPILNPTGSFIVNGTILNITGSVSSSIYLGPSNTPTTIYIPTGSTFNDTLNNIVASFNISSSFSFYSSSLQYITAQNSSSNLNFTTSFNLDGDLANSYYAVSGSTTLYFSGGTGSFLNTIPKKDILAESYKRIYHNLPLLLQRKGTVAGLRTLLTTFGISNQDYYTVSGSTYYTPTGSALTSSILNIKEYGGSTTEELLAGYNNNKVRLISNITASVSGTFGNVLSPYTSVMQYTTASSNFRTTDQHYVDISFSPQTQIDTYASKSIASTNTNWLIDNYIGNPQQLYSGSYSDLDAQRKTYFVDGTGSYVGFTSSLLDYNGFIRLIQFFDNSIFKMLEDNVPARASLSTGVTINSPVLERNKWSYARINNTTNELEKDGKINAPIFTSIYDDYYSSMPNNKAAYFTGGLSGSQLSINNYFTTGNFNPYLRDLTPYNNNQSPYQQADTNNFLHSDFNVLQNNVSRSLTSTSRQKLEILGNSGILGSGSYVLLVTASLQDSYLSLDSYNLSRYKGVKVSSMDYNIYTSGSSVYDGDKSYGKTAAIDHYVRKFGLFTQVVSSSFFVNRNTVALKYLVDESGSLTELNQSKINSSIENHWFDVQNTFKTDTAAISLFDNQMYGDQKGTDGEKVLFDSGYSYYPLLYYTGSDLKLYFQYAGNGNGILLHTNFSGSSLFVTGSTSNRYTASAFTSGTGSIYPIFDKPDPKFSNGFSYYSNIKNLSGSTQWTNNFPTYSVPQNANMAFSANFGISIQFPTASNSVTYKFDLIASGSSLANLNIGSQTQTFTSSGSVLSSTLVFNVTSSFRDYTPGDQITFQLRQYGVIAGTGSFTSSFLSTGDGTIFDGLRNYIAPSNINPFAITSSGQFISGSNGLDTFYLNQSLSSFIDYVYLPATSSANLHKGYGNINNAFAPKVGDVMLVYYNNNNQYQEFNINRITPGTNLGITVTPNLVTNLATGSYVANQISTVLLLSKQPDETNINLIFDKEDGQTSYGFVIPNNLSPDVLKNIDTITRQVKTKLISNGNQGLTINTV